MIDLLWIPYIIAVTFMVGWAAGWLTRYTRCRRGVKCGDRQGRSGT